MRDPLHKGFPAPVRFALVGDDLTGACDAGVQFARRGFSTLVRISEATPEPQAFDLLVLTTNSRSDAREIASAKVREACATLRNEEREFIFKKIDSTLRGNLGCELQAVMEACGFSMALVAPAFPVMGRTLEAGVLRVRGSMHSEPIHLPDLLRRQCSCRVVHIGRAAWGNGCVALVERLTRLTQEKTIVVPDSTCDDDLRIIARAANNLSAKTLLAGSAGLAAAAAEIMAERFRRSSRLAPDRTSEERAPGSVLLVMGSTHPVTRAQIDFLVRSRPVTSIGLDDHAHQQALKAAKEGRHLLAVAPPQLDRERLAKFLSVFRDPTVRGVALSGGDTAFAILRALGASGIKLEGEVLPGIPFGHVAGGLAHGMPVVTKAGGFGAENALALVADFLAQQTRTE